MSNKLRSFTKWIALSVLYLIAFFSNQDNLILQIGIVVVYVGIVVIDYWIALINVNWAYRILRSVAVLLLLLIVFGSNSQDDAVIFTSLVLYLIVCVSNMVEDCMRGERIIPENFKKETQK